MSNAGNEIDPKRIFAGSARNGAKMRGRMLLTAQLMQPVEKHKIPAMKSASDLLFELNRSDESSGIEAKRSSELGRSTLETICAFSNEPGLGGGYLLLGVERSDFGRGLQYIVPGIIGPDKVQSDLVSQCNSAFNRPLRPQINVEQLQGKNVIVVFIPELGPTEKPAYLKASGLPRGAFRRAGPTDHEGTEDDLLALYAQHRGQTYDSSVLAESSYDDIDLEAVKDYRGLRVAASPGAEELQWTDEELLESLACLVRDNAAWKPTVAGILLFGTTKALRRCFPMMRLDYIRVPGRQWVENPDHRFDTVEIRAALITAIRRATKAVVDDIPKTFLLPPGDIQSQQNPLLSARVIREAVVNAVMHRSYRIHGAVQIIRYSNRLEIRNPGHSLKAEDKLGEPGSATRNPMIAAALHETNVAETKGSGIRVMREIMRQSNLSPPTFESSQRPDQFVATFLFHHFLETEDIAWLAGLTTEPISDEEARALIYVREVGAIDNARYREINRSDTLEASGRLRRLRDLNLLATKGAGNRTYYVPGAAFRIVDAEGAASEEFLFKHRSGDESEILDMNNSESRKPGADESRKPGEESRKPAAAESRELAEESRKPGAAESRKLKAETSKRARHTEMITHAPDFLAKMLGHEGRLRDPPKIRAAILKLCGWRPLNARQLAGLLKRGREPLVRDYLRPMVDSGELVYTIPANPTHPEQSYAAAPDSIHRQKKRPHR